MHERSAGIVVHPHMEGGAECSAPRESLTAFEHGGSLAVTLPGAKIGPDRHGVQGADAASWSAAGALLETLRFTFGAEAAALFAFGLGDHTPRVSLVIADGLTQGGLDRVADVWERGRASLLGGQPSGGDDPSFLVLPCPDDRGLAGVVYLEGEAVFRRSRLALLVSFAPVVARVLRRLDGLDDLVEEPVPMSSPNADAASLHLLLDHNEWNVSRVARVLGVTRMTIYNRLRRFAIQRQRVSKHGAPAQRRPREVVSHA